MQELKKIWSDLNLEPLIRRTLVSLANKQREQYEEIGYVLFTLPDNMPALPSPRGWLRKRIQGEPPISLAELERAFHQIADDPRAKGVILHLRGLAMPLADLQSLRSSIKRLSEKGKRVVCFAQDYDTASYFVASAADEILLQTGSTLSTIGLRANAIFLKDSLSALGVELDVVAISPYKSAVDQLSRSDFSPESRAQIDWLLDSRYEIIVSGIAEGRGVEKDAVLRMIDSAPHIDQEALAAGYVDAVLNEEGLAAHLQIKPDQILSWEQARKRLFVTLREPSKKIVALLKISGMIVNGESENPPVPLPIPLVGGERAGDLTVVQQARQLMANPKVGAVVLYIDSPGGSASASEAMAATLDELAKKVPVVVYMNNVAASGGYYVATSGQWIVAQPGTITGSIGVVMAKAITEGTFARLHANRVELIRGANAGFMSDHAPFSDEQRALMRKNINSIYELFVSRVARSRKMSPEAVDEIGGGRVWTGAQALENGLVDQLGDLRAALHKARELAGLPDNAPLVISSSGKPERLAPQLADLDPAAALRYAYDNLKMITSTRAQLLMPLLFE